MATAAKTLQEQLQKEVAAYQSLQKDYDKAIGNRTQLESQLKENEQVQAEFKFLKDDAAIYKMIGPCLVKQDRAEADSNVAKRIEFIQGEIKRSEALIKDLQEKQEKKKMEIVKLEAVYQQQVAAK
jgi:prefoldin beta subunit